MAYYSVIVPIHFDYRIEADTEDEAIEKACHIADCDREQFRTTATSIEVQDSDAHAGELADDRDSWEEDVLKGYP